jgi:hypothetical protein
MPRFLTCLVPFILIAALGKAVAETDLQRLPDMTGYFLDGEAISLPSDLEDPATLLVITREGQGGEDFESWRDVASGLSGEVSAVYVVLMNHRRGIARAVAAGRLRRDVSDPELRASMVPVFQDGREVDARLGLGAGVSAMLVDQRGEILWQAIGAADDAAAADIRRLLERPARVREQPAPSSLPWAAPVGPPYSAEPPEAVAARGPPGVSAGLTPFDNAPVPLMPPLDGVTLAGRSMRLPDDLSETGTQLVLIPDYEGSDTLRSVLALMQENPGNNWLVLAFRGRTPRLGKAFEAGRLRGEIETADWREKVLPVYMEISAFERIAGLVPSDRLRLIRVNEAGAITRIECLGGDC